MKGTILTLQAVAAFFACVTIGAVRGQLPGDPYQSDDHLRGVPIPSGPDAPTMDQLMDVKVQWFERMMLDPYNKSANPDPQAAEFIVKAIRNLCDPNKGPSEGELMKEEEALSTKGVNDPMFCLAAAIVEADRQREDEYMKLALKGFAQRPAPAFMQFMASVNIGMGLHQMQGNDGGGGNPALDSRDSESLRFFRAAMDEYPFNANEGDVLMWRLVSLPVQDLFSRRAKEANGILQESLKVPQWIREYWLGQQYLTAAWAAKDPADSGDPGGNFAANLALAREHFTKSFELNPKDPNAATKMITVAMGEKEKTDTMRKWFDRAVAACIDFAPPYDNFIRGLENLGTSGELIRFGEECMRNGRYDTDVPFYYVMAVKCAAQDMVHNNPGERKNVFTDPDMNDNLLKVLDGCIASKTNSMDHNYLQALAAIVAYKGGKFEAAKQYLQAIGNKIDKKTDQFEYDAANPALARSRIVARWSDEFRDYVDLNEMMRKLRDGK